MESKITLLNCDCMDYMREQPNKAFDLAICDPPYGIGKRAFAGKKNDPATCRYVGQYGKTYPNSELDRPTPEYFEQLFRICENAVIWGANHLCDLFNAKSTGWIIWNKETTVQFSDAELAFTTFDIPLKMYTYQWNGLLQGRLGDVRKKEIRIHPNQKPVKLYDWVLKNYAKPGQRILDTHLGSASSAIAAHYFGVDFVGCEIDKHYYDLAVERLERETAQIDMFQADSRRLIDTDYPVSSG